MRKWDSARITAWGTKVFGPTTTAAIFKRTMKEVKEAQDQFDNIDWEKLYDELADISIMLHQVAATLGHNLDDDVDRKMDINECRKWKLSGDGTGQHE